MASHAGGDHVVASTDGPTRSLLLNRPKALNALDLDMIRRLYASLESWQSQNACQLVILDKADRDHRAFCAGGDIVTLSKAYKSNDEAEKQSALDFFREEYRLNHLIGTYEKPIVAVVDGIVMGGGVGISLHAPVRIATERSLFAMPETAIGLIPDVGGSFFLPRLDGATGSYLGITGARLRGLELFQAGLATHFIRSDRLAAALLRVRQLPKPTLATVCAALDEFAADEATSADWSDWPFGGDRRRAIDRCFRHGSMRAVEGALEAEAGLSDAAAAQPAAAWARQTLSTLKNMSPSSCKAALKQIRTGRDLDFAACFKLEMHMVQRILARHDFFEGVDANLIRKTKDPRWEPSWAQVDQSLPDAQVAAQFGIADALRRGADAPPFCSARTFIEYPHRYVSGLPMERDVLAYLEHARADSGRVPHRDYVREWFVRNWGTPRARVLVPDGPGRDAAFSLLDGQSELARARPGLTGRLDDILQRMYGSFARRLD